MHTVECRDILEVPPIVKNELICLAKYERNKMLQIFAQFLSKMKKIKDRTTFSLAYYFVIISTWKKDEPFIWINLNPLHPCAKFCQNWLSGSGEVDEIWKSLQTDRPDRRTDGRTTRELTWPFSSGEQKIKWFQITFFSVLDEN